MSLVEQYVKWVYLDKMDNVLFILCQDNPDYRTRIAIIRTMSELRPYMGYRMMWRSYQKCMTSAFQWSGPLVKKYLLGQIETIYCVGDIVERFGQYLEIVGHGTIWQHILLHDMMQHSDQTWKYAVILLKIIVDQPYQDLLQDLYVTNTVDTWSTDIVGFMDELEIEGMAELEYIKLLLPCRSADGSREEMIRIGYQLYQGMKNLMKVMTIYDDNMTIQGLINYNYWKDQLYISPAAIQMAADA
jgi:hypothetical protein